MKPVARFDRWVDSGPFNAVDLRRYQVLFALALLLTLPSFDWVKAFPDALYSPPPGPYRLLHGFPPSWVLQGLEIVVAVSAAFLLCGVFPRTASVAVSMALVIGGGFAYSLGKIDHTILRSLTPLVLVFAAWGAPKAELRASHSQAQWPLRLLALITGLALFTAALPKYAAGWFDPRTQAVQSTLFREFYLNDRQELLAGWFVNFTAEWFWEALDWATVILEAVVVLAVLNWRAFRIVLAMLALFHLCVYLMMNISFAGNVLVYAAFVQWSVLPLPSVRPSRAIARVVPLVAVIIGVGAWVLNKHGLATSSWFSPVVLFTGGAVALWYLLRQVREGVRWLGRHRARKHQLATVQHD